MVARRSKPLFVGEFVPDKQGRGQRALTTKYLVEQLRLTSICLRIANLLLNDPKLSVKEAINRVSRETARSPSSIEKLYEQNGECALNYEAELIFIKDRTVIDRYEKRLKERATKKRQ